MAPLRSCNCGIDGAGIGRDNRRVRYPREPDPEPMQFASAVLIAVREIDEDDEEQLDALVSAFLCAAWPTLLAQNQ